jgi:hypothetical protein
MLKITREEKKIEAKRDQKKKRKLCSVPRSIDFEATRSNQFNMHADKSRQKKRMIRQFIFAYTSSAYIRDQGYHDAYRKDLSTEQDNTCTFYNYSAQIKNSISTRLIVYTNLDISIGHTITPGLEKGPNASHMCVRIKFHIYDRRHKRIPETMQ